MTYADTLNGRLMLYYGTADNNVHPSNMMQLIQALQRAGKSFDLQAGLDQGHSGLNQARMRSSSSRTWFCVILKSGEGFGQNSIDRRRPGIHARREITGDGVRQR